MQMLIPGGSRQGLIGVVALVHAVGGRAACCMV
jgi:hypothetical protein